MIRPFRDAPAFIADPLGFIAGSVAKAERSFAPLWLGFRPLHLLADSHHVRDVLAAPEARFHKGRLNDQLRQMIGYGVITARDDRARDRRRLLHVHFRQEALEEKVELIHATVTQSVAEAMQVRGPIALSDFTKKMALRTISVVLLGERLFTDAEERRLLSTLSLIEGELAMRIWRMWPAMPWSERASQRRFAQYHAEFDDLIESVVARAGPRSVVQTLRDGGLCKQDIRDELLTVLVAGHETTASAAAWLLYHLAARPDWQQKIGEEVDGVTDDLGEIPVKRWRELTRTAAAVNETLRLYPSAWTFSREVGSDLEIGGYRLKRGQSVVVSPYALQRDPRIWTNANQWEPGRDQAPFKAAFYPFGVGQRACIGAALAVFELQMIAATFCGALNMIVADPRLEPRPIPSVTLHPDPKLAISVRARTAVRADIWESVA